MDKNYTIKIVCGHHIVDMSMRSPQLFTEIMKDVDCSKLISSENRGITIMEEEDMNTLKIKKLHPDAIIPTRAHATDAGLDLYALEDALIVNGETQLVKTGIAVDIPVGYEAQVRPRSGLTLKTGLKIQLGTIDSGYTGDVGVIVYNSDRGEPANGGVLCWKVHKGDKIAQLVISPIVTPAVKVVDDFDAQSERGSNGFGSTDKESGY